MDVSILGLLQNNARLSVKEIAAEVALAPSSTQFVDVIGIVRSAVPMSMKLNQLHHVVQAAIG